MASLLPLGKPQQVQVLVRVRVLVLVLVLVRVRVRVRGHCFHPVCPAQATAVPASHLPLDSADRCVE